MGDQEDMAARVSGNAEPRLPLANHEAEVPAAGAVSWREVICDTCGGEGCGEYYDTTRYPDPNTGEPYSVSWSCKACAGTGGVLVLTEPQTEDDFLQIWGEA